MQTACRGGVEVTIGVRIGEEAISEHLRARTIRSGIVGGNQSLFLNRHQKGENRFASRRWTPRPVVSELSMLSYCRLMSTLVLSGHRLARPHRSKSLPAADCAGKALCGLASQESLLPN